MERELTRERIAFLEKDYRRGFVQFCGFQASEIAKGLFESTSEIISQGKQIIVAQSTVFDVRNTHEKMVSRSTVTLMAIDADKLGK